MPYKLGREAPHFSMDLSSVFDKKWGILIKKESESLIFTGLKIPRDYYIKLVEKVDIIILGIKDNNETYVMQYKFKRLFEYK